MTTLGTRAVWVILTLALVALTATFTPPEASGFLVRAEAAESSVLDPAVAAAEADEDDGIVVKGEVQVLDESNFERLTQVATGATTGDWFIKFYAPWCGHCRKLEPTWNELAEKLGGQVNVGKVDVTKNKSLGKRFGVKSFPTLLMFSHGKLYKHQGGRKLDSLLDFAKGGFKSGESLDVPKPRGISGGAKEVLSQLGKDLAGLRHGKLPGTSSLILVLLAVLMLMLVVLMMLPPPKPTVVPRSKVE